MKEYTIYVIIKSTGMQIKAAVYDDYEKYSEELSLIHNMLKDSDRGDFIRIYDAIVKVEEILFIQGAEEQITLS